MEDKEKKEVLKKPKKNNRKLSYSVARRQEILDIYEFCRSKRSKRELATNKYHRAIIADVSKICDVSETTVYAILKEKKENDEREKLGLPKVYNKPDPTPSKKKPKKPVKVRNTTAKFNHLDPYDKEVIRRKFHEFYSLGILPTVKQVIKAQNDDPNLTNKLGLVAMTSTLSKMNCLVDPDQVMKYKRPAGPINREDMRKWRNSYIRTIQKYREEGKHIYYIAELTIRVGDLDKVWLNQPITRYNTGKRKPKKEPKDGEIILHAIHIASSSGLLDRGLMLYNVRESKDKDKDSWEDCKKAWFKKILYSLKGNSVIVMENDFCRSENVEHTPTTAWKEDKLLFWLKSKGVRMQHQRMRRKRLRKFAALYLSKHDEYEIDEFAKNSGRTVLRLPPVYDKLNAMTSAWDLVRTFVRTNTTTYRLYLIKRLVRHGLKSLDAEKWKALIDQTIVEEESLVDDDFVLHPFRSVRNVLRDDEIVTKKEKADFNEDAASDEEVPLNTKRVEMFCNLQSDDDLPEEQEPKRKSRRLRGEKAETDNSDSDESFSNIPEDPSNLLEVHMVESEISDGEQLQADVSKIPNRLLAQSDMVEVYVSEVEMSDEELLQIPQITRVESLANQIPEIKTSDTEMPNEESLKEETISKSSDNSDSDSEIIAQEQKTPNIEISESTDTSDNDEIEIPKVTQKRKMSKTKRTARKASGKKMSGRFVSSESSESSESSVEMPKKKARRMSKAKKLNAESSEMPKTAYDFQVAVDDVKSEDVSGSDLSDA